MVVPGIPTAIRCWRRFRRGLPLPELREIIRFDRWDEFLGQSGDLANPELHMVRSTDGVMIQYIVHGHNRLPKGALLHHYLCGLGQ